MTLLLNARMNRRNLKPYQVANILRVHRQKSEEYGDGDIVTDDGDSGLPRAFSRQVVIACRDADEHQKDAAIVDAIDSILTPLMPIYPTKSDVGSEARIEVYARRFQRGEALFHESDSKDCHPLDINKERIHETIS